MVELHAKIVKLNLKFRSLMLDVTKTQFNAYISSYIEDNLQRSIKLILLVPASF